MEVWKYTPSKTLGKIEQKNSLKFVKDHVDTRLNLSESELNKFGGNTTKEQLDLRSPWELLQEFERNYSTIFDVYSSDWQKKDSAFLSSVTVL